MESGSKKQLLKRIASLVSENKELKDKQRVLSEQYHQLLDEVGQCREWIEKSRTEQSDTIKQTFQQTKV